MAEIEPKAVQSKDDVSQEREEDDSEVDLGFEKKEESVGNNESDAEKNRI